MSNKTIFKRIALFAVAALGAGTLASTPAQADNNAAVGAANATQAAGILNVATLLSTSGDAETSKTAASNKSLGLLAVSTSLTTSSLTSTATVLSSGEIVFYHLQTAGTNEVATTIEVSGGVIDEFAGAHSGSGGTDLTSTGTDPNLLLNSTKTMLAGGADANDDIFIAFGVKPNSGATSMTVSVYESAALASGSDDAMEQSLLGILAGSVSKGTLKQRYVVTVASTSTSGVYDASSSYIVGATAAADDTTETVDATNSLRIASQTAPYAYININLRDAYDVSLDGGKGALIITGTNGAGIAYKANGTAATSASDFNLTQVSNTSAAGTITVTKPAARANKSFSTTVSITWNGVVVGTKSVTFLGEVAKVTATPRLVGALNASNEDAFRVSYEDDAGNALIGLGTTATTVVAATTNEFVTGASIGTQGTSTDLAKGTIACAAGSSDYLGGGSANLQLRHVNAASGSVVLSNVFKAECQGNAYSYTASWDKASYTPGSVATLTIAFKDRDGNIANSYDDVSTTANLITVTGGPSTTAVTAPANGDSPTSGDGMSGIKTYQFTVGTTEGDYVAVVSVPVVNGRNGAQGNLSVAYSVKNASSAVTNAEVLAAIVKLIASINKQIRALQKSLRR